MDHALNKRSGFLRPVSYLNNFRLHPLWIRYSSWEFWPSWLMYGPVVLIWLLQAIRAGKLFFFSAVNPAIPTGGWLGESKWDILNRMPKNLYPETLFIPKGTDIASILGSIRHAGIQYPFIAKPDVGERGFLVQHIQNEEELKAHFNRVNADMMIQAFIPLPLEVSALCYRNPVTQEAEVTSLCIKEFLEVVGDGRHTLEELILQKPRAILRLSELRNQFQNQWKQVVPEGTTLLLEPIGNHCRGTKFIDVNHQIDDQLTKVLIGLLDQMEDIQYGRFDLRTKSLEDLRQGEHFQIFEFNGVGSDPAHLYDPKHSISSIYTTIWRHFTIMREIYQAQRQKGVKAMGWLEAWQYIQVYREYKKTAQSSNLQVQTPNHY